jgi:2-polyprenyl-3-methyl-5-hydroxy-6-metoxy-1,4-benzoquinol methylase
MKCRLCNSHDTFIFADLGLQPLANKYPKNKKEISKEKKFPMELIFCNLCLSAQIKKIIDRKYLFEDYYYLSSVNKGLIDHFFKLSKKIKQNDFVLDIGSNDGIFLQHLKNRKIKFLGVDPSINVGQIANSKGLTTIIDFFNKKTVNKIIKKYGRPNIIVASSIFTHLKNPSEFIKNLKVLLPKNGTFILEIEYVRSIINKKHFERFYFDRPYYYSLNSINKLFTKNKLSLVNYEIIKTHGGSIRCFIKHDKISKKSDKLKKALIMEKNILQKNNIQKFSNIISKYSDDFARKINSMQIGKKIVIGYGCPARVSTITNLSSIGKKQIKFIIDDSPLKAGKFSPGMNIPIKKIHYLSKKKEYIVIVFAYDYFYEIQKKLISYNCEFYFPIPLKKITT